MRETPAEADLVELQDSPAAPAQVSRSRRRGSFTGEKIGGNRVIAVQGLLNSGVSKSKIAKDLQISRNSVIAIEQRMKVEGIVDPHRVERIRETFQERHVLLCDDAMRQIDTRKLKQSSAWDLVKISEKAAQLGGLVQQHSPAQGQLFVLAQFNLQQGQPFISSPDLASEAAGGHADGDGQIEVDP